MKRSVIAFARGARIGVRMIRMSVPVKTASNVAVNFVVPVADQEQELVGAFAEVHQEVAGLLGHPGPGGMGGDPGEVYAATAVLDHQQDVQAAEEDGVDVGEVDGKDRVGLRAEELRPGGTGPTRRRIESRVLQNLPDSRRGHGIAEADQLALDAPVPPAGILAGHPQHQCPDRLRCGRPARLSSRVGPASGHEVGVPAQQGPRRDEPEPAQLRGQQPAERAEERAVDPGQGRVWVASA